MDLRTMLKQPRAFLPVTMSAIAFATVLGHIVAQLPIVAFFAIKFVPRTPKAAVVVLALQAAAGLAALAPVFFYHL